MAGLKRRDLFERVFAVAGRFGDEAPALDELLQPHARRGIVFDDQHALGAGVRAGLLRRCHFYILRASAGNAQVQYSPLLVDPKNAPDRVVALLEVLVCSDYPTQIVIGQVLTVAGLRAQTSGGELSITFVAALSLADTVALVGLIVLLLRVHGERPRRVLFGDHAVGGEAMAGVPLALVSLVIAIAVLATIQLAVPSLHTVAHNPLQDLLHTPRDLAIFAAVVVVAGGVREEIQRAFLLHRFEQSLGGGAVGILVVSLAFGAGHLLQGVDAAIATGVLGAFWGFVYLRRRSAVAPMVAHSAFNLLQLVQFLVIGR